MQAIDLFPGGDRPSTASARWHTRINGSLDLAGGGDVETDQIERLVFRLGV